MMRVAALLLLLCACSLERDAGPVTAELSRPLAPCIHSWLSDAIMCPDFRQREREVENDEVLCECPRIVTEGSAWDADAGIECGTEYVTQNPNGLHGYERNRACPAGGG